MASKSDNEHDLPFASFLKVIYNKKENVAKPAYLLAGENCLYNYLLSSSILVVWLPEQDQDGLCSPFVKCTRHVLEVSCCMHGSERG